VNTVYCIGYSGRQSGELLDLADRVEAVVVDIRFSPASRIPAWSRKRLSELLGGRYVHVRELGNKNYRSGGPIALVDYEAGRRQVERLLQELPVLLLCVCADPTECHRTFVADLLRRDGFEVRELSAAGRGKGGAPIG
jgi:uncharacterized protein (DUF488 family)